MILPDLPEHSYKYRPQIVGRLQPKQAGFVLVATKHPKSYGTTSSIIPKHDRQDACEPLEQNCHLATIVEVFQNS
jgi:hypothetical protein